MFKKLGFETETMCIQYAHSMCFQYTMYLICKYICAVKLNDSYLLSNVMLCYVYVNIHPFLTYT